MSNPLQTNECLSQSVVKALPFSPKSDGKVHEGDDTYEMVEKGLREESVEIVYSEVEVHTSSSVHLSNLSPDEAVTEVYSSDGMSFGDINSDSMDTEESSPNDDEEEVSGAKVIVEVLPKFEFSGLSALAELHSLSVFSRNSSSKSELSSTSRNVSSEVDVEAVFKERYSSSKSELSSSSRNSSSEVDVEAVSEAPDSVGSDKRISKNNHPSRDKQVSKRSLKKRNKSYTGFNHSIYSGKGKKLLDIKHIPSELSNTPAQVIRILHYLLYGIYGVTATEALLQDARRNILHFSGFVFSEDSDMFLKKKKTLWNLPYPLLASIHKTLINSTPLNREHAVISLLQFLQKPTDAPFCFAPDEEEPKVLSEEEIERLKSEALEARPVVLLKRLATNHCEKISSENEEDEKQTCADGYVKPSFIHCSNGVHLKCFPKIVLNVQKARHRIVNLLHSLLYGRPGSDMINRKNILEFNGFSSSKKKFVARKMTFLKRLRPEELEQLCDVFCLRLKTENKGKKIIELLQFLSRPQDVTALKKPRRGKQSTKKQSANGDKKVEQRPSKTDLNDNGTTPDKQSVKLRDFDKICSKVECATPDFLSELNDLLFVKPCDVSEIHEKILDFSSFTFGTNSFEFHCRKTILHYMDMKTVRKIADLLDIENWEYCRSHEDLTQSILNFLMNMKLPERRRRKPSSNLKNKKQNHRPNIMKLDYYREFSKSRSYSPEYFDSTYASDEVIEDDWDMNARGPCNLNNVAEFYEERKNGMLLKPECTFIDSMPICEIVKHPTDTELFYEIDKIIGIAPLSATIGEVVNEVLKCYPNFNLQYRIDFIRNKALEMLRELRENIVKESRVMLA